MDYWQELCDILDWANENVTSTFCICWGAQAAVYHYYGLQKELLTEKLSGIYSHTISHRKVPLIRGFDDVFQMPHSRHTTVPAEKLHACEDLLILAESEEAGVLLCMSKDGRRVFCFGHGEYDRMTLDTEYRRDMGRGLNPHIPVNYYPDDDPEKTPLLTWRSQCDLMYSNWLNYYVYQNTPYMWGQILDAEKMKKASEDLTTSAT